VDEEIVAKAIALADWQLAVRKQYDPIDADNQTARIEEKMRRDLGVTSLTTRELQRTINAARSGMWFFNTAITNLQKAGELQWDRKEHRWRLAK